MRCIGRLLLLGMIVIGVVVVIAVAAGINSGKDEDSPVTTGSVRAASYTIATDDDSSIAGRERRRIVIVMDPVESNPALQAGLADAVRNGFDKHPDAEVIVVFAVSDESLANQAGADVGRAFASTDGGGLGGDNGGLLGPDEEGQIQIEVRSLSSDAVQSTTRL